MMAKCSPLRLKEQVNLTSFRSIFSVGLHKNRYIFPVSVKVLSTPSVLNEMQYIARVVIDKRVINATTCYLLIDPEYHIRGLSSSCISLLNISTNTRSNSIVDAKLIAPDIFKEDIPRRYLHKTGDVALIYYPSGNEFSKIVYKNSI